MDLLKTNLITIWENITSWVMRLLQWIQHNPGMLAITLVLALIPALFWLWMYRRRVHTTDEQRAMMYRTFVFGMLSVFPVLWVSYIVANFFGYDPNYFIQSGVRQGAYLTVFIAFLFVAVNEEFAKYLIVKRVDYRRREWNRVADSIELAAAAALGFAFIENITYFVITIRLYGASAEFIQVVIFRSLGSMLAHTVFSGFYGYYHGRARFVGMGTDTQYVPWWHFGSKEGNIEQSEHLTDLLLPQKKVRMKKSVSGRLMERQLILGGLATAMTLHAIYNFLLEYNLVAFTVPFIAAQYLFIQRELQLNKNLTQHLFSQGGRTVVSIVGETGELQIEDPLVQQMLLRWDEYGARIAEHNRERYDQKTYWTASEGVSPQPAAV